jgi:uncharacterized sporulation protein YeaH/YhbH (DUF444 family)
MGIEPDNKNPRSFGKPGSWSPRDLGCFTGIDRDVDEYRKIVKGKLREDLKEYIQSKEIIAQHGKDIISIPMPEIQAPHFTFGNPKEGAGEGALPGEDGDEGPGKREAGDKSDQHNSEQFHVDELADMLGEHLKLPRIQPRNTTGLEQFVPIYKSISRHGPSSLRDNKRTFRTALRRAIAEGTYDEADPVIVPTREDYRYKSPVLTPRPKTNAVLFYIMDVSGSMGDEQKYLTRNTAFWTDAWIDRQYQGTEKCYIIHDAEARVVDRETFFSTTEAGGTKISSAYDVLRREIATTYRPEDWNIYVFHFSDGDNWGGDSSVALDMLRQDVLPHVNLFGYVQTESQYGSGQFLKDVEGGLKGREEVVSTRMKRKEDIIPVIRTLLGTGR